jgi:hypothetical protein
MMEDSAGLSARRRIPNVSREPHHESAKADEALTAPMIEGSLFAQAPEKLEAEAGAELQDLRGGGLGILGAVVRQDQAVGGHQR